MTLKDFVKNNPDALFDLIPNKDDDNGLFTVTVTDEKGNTLEVFSFETMDSAYKAIDNAIAGKGLDIHG